MADTPTWLDPADVRRWLRDNAQPPANDDLELDRVCRQTEIHVEKVRGDAWYPSDPQTDPPTEVYLPDAEIMQGAIMYAARMLRRRNSPAGVETYGGLGATFVARYDPDIDRALRTGAFTPPGVG
jgi:hypothetical protein